MIISESLYIIALWESLAGGELPVGAIFDQDNVVKSKEYMFDRILWICLPLNIIILLL